MPVRLHDPNSLDAWVIRIKDLLLILASFSGMIAAIWWIFVFVTGGVKPIDRINLENLTLQVNELKERVSDIDRAFIGLGERVTKDEIDIARNQEKIKMEAR